MDKNYVNIPSTVTDPNYRYIRIPKIKNPKNLINNFL